MYTVDYSFSKASIPGGRKYGGNKRLVHAYASFTPTFFDVLVVFTRIIPHAVRSSAVAVHFPFAASKVAFDLVFALRAHSLYFNLVGILPAWLFL